MILNGKKKKGGTETFANERMGIYIGVCVRERERERLGIGLKWHFSAVLVWLGFSCFFTQVSE